MSEIDSEHAKMIWQAMSRRALLAGGAGVGAAGLVSALPMAGVAGAETTASGEGPFASGASGAPAAINPDALPVAVPGAVMRTVSPVMFNAVGLSAGASLVGTFSPPFGAYTANGEATFAALDVPPGGTLKQVDCYAYATTSAVPPGHWLVLSYDSQGSNSAIGSVTPPTGPGITQHTFASL